MRHPITILAFLLVACGGASPPAGSPPAAATSATPASGGADAPAESPAPGAQTRAGAAASAEPTGGGDGSGPAQYTTLDTHTAKETHGAHESKLAPTSAEALLKFVVVDKDKGPITGVVISLSGPDGKKFYTEETDGTGYAEVLVPIAKKYDVVYVSLGRSDVAAQLEVEDKPRQTVKLTLRYKRFVPAAAPATGKPEPERFVLDGVNFDSSKATLRSESFPRLDRVVEYMTHKPKSRIQISGHTDNAGKKAANKSLSEKRAQACKDYLVSKGIDASRVEAIGYGDERPIASNDSAEGREQNRRIEAIEQ